MEGTSPSGPPPLFPTPPTVRSLGLVRVFSEKSGESARSFPAVAGSSLWGRVLQEGLSRDLRPSRGLPGDPGSGGWGDDGCPACGDLLGLSHFTVTRELRCLSLFPL